MAIESLKQRMASVTPYKLKWKNKKSNSERTIEPLKRIRAGNDNVVTFEHLEGVQTLFVDESHNYKTSFYTPKMRNVAGIADGSAEIFGYVCKVPVYGRTDRREGHHICNRYADYQQYDRIIHQYALSPVQYLTGVWDWGILTVGRHRFGETQTAIELAPEGTGYRAKTRFAKFFNLPELIALFKESAEHTDAGYAEASCAGSGL